MAIAVVGHVGTAGAAPAPARVSVRSDALAASHAEAIAPSVREAAEQVLREHDVPLAPDATMVVGIELRPITKTKERDKVIFRVSVLEGERQLYGGQPTSCWGCDDDALLASIRAQVAESAAHVPEQPEPAVEHAPSVVAPADEGNQAEPTTEDQLASLPPAVTKPVPSPPLTLRNVGIALMASGAVAVGVGIGLVVAKERITERDDEHVAGRDLRPAGVALSVVSGVALAGGVALLVLHATRTKKAKRTAWMPVGAPGHVGFVVEGRF